MKDQSLRMCKCALAVLLTVGATNTAVARAITSVGVSVGSLGNPYFVAAVKGIEARATKITPNARVVAVSSDFDLGKQFAQVSAFIAAGAQIIMINAADPIVIGPALMPAHKAGVVVGAFDGAAEGADVTVRTDNVTAGEQACQYIVDHLQGGKGDVLILNAQQTSPVVDRVEGCEKVLKSHSGINILSDNQNALATRDGGFAVGRNLLTRFSHVDAAFCINDQTALGLALAAKQQNRHEFFVTSVDGAPDIVQEIRNKDGMIKASAAQDPYTMAATAYSYAVDIVNGKAPPAKVVRLTPKLITIDNVDSYEGWDPTKAD